MKPQNDDNLFVSFSRQLESNRLTKAAHFQKSAKAHTIQ